MVRRRGVSDFEDGRLRAGALLGSPFGGGDVALLKALANLSMSFRKPLGVRSDLWGMMYLRVVSVG